MTTPHPAKFTDAILRAAARFLKLAPAVLDCFVGTGKLADLWFYGVEAEFHGTEIEPEWCAMALANGVKAVLADAQHLPYPDGTFPAVLTSPTYGNRLADHAEWKDSSKRNTYKSKLGRKLHPNNSGRLQWGRKYRDFHHRVWLEVWRVLQPGGLFLLNVSDHERRAKVMPVTAWHIATLQAIGLELVEHVKIETPRLRHGENHECRVPYESLLVFRKPGHRP